MKGVKGRQFSELSHNVIGAAIEVHRALGPGLLEGVYEQCLAHQLALDGIAFRQQHALPVCYKGLRIEYGYRVDLLVDDEIIVELKSIERLTGIHEAQILTYMKLGGFRQGLLINFNTKRLKDSMKSFVM